MWNLAEVSISSILENIWKWISTEGLKVIIGGILLFILCKIINFVIRRLDKKLESKKVDKTLRIVLLPWAGRILKFIGACVYIGYLGFETSSISAAIASLGVTIGLALQGSLSNLAAGIVILVTRPFRIGDKIKCENVEGVVENISIMYTYIVTGNNEMVCIPNSEITSNKLINYMAKDKIRQELRFSVAYNADYKRAKELIMQCVKDNGKCLEDPEPTIVLSEQADSALILSLKVWTTHDVYWDVRYDLMERVTDTLLANNIEIPYNQLDVHMR